MRIPIPKWLSSAWAPIEDWINVPVYYKVRRIDVILVLLGIFCASYYWYYGGWQQAIIGGLMFILMTMIGLWFFR